MAINGNLDRKLRLSDLVSPESLASLCSQLTALHGVPIVVEDGDGTTIWGAWHEEPFCGDAGCEVCDAQPPRFAPVSDKVAAASCDNGAVYLRCELSAQLEPLGAVVLGPFVEGSAASPALPALARDRAEAILRLVTSVFEEVAYASYQSYLTSKMYLECYAQIRSELVDKDHELEKYEQTLRESTELRSLF